MKLIYLQPNTDMSSQFIFYFFCGNRFMFSIHIVFNQITVNPVFLGG